MISGRLRKCGDVLRLSDGSATRISARYSMHVSVSISTLRAIDVLSALLNIVARVGYTNDHNGTSQGISSKWPNHRSWSGPQANARRLYLLQDIPSSRLRWKNVLLLYFIMSIIWSWHWIRNCQVEARNSVCLRIHLAVTRDNLHSRINISNQLTPFPQILRGIWFDKLDRDIESSEKPLEAETSPGKVQGEKMFTRWSVYDSPWGPPCYHTIPTAVSDS